MGNSPNVILGEMNVGFATRSNFFPSAWGIRGQMAPGCINVGVTPTKEDYAQVLIRLAMSDGEVSGVSTIAELREKGCMPVILTNGEEKIVPTYMLDYLIRENKIVAFSEVQWVGSMRDPIRKSQLPLINSGERWSDFMFKRT